MMKFKTWIAQLLLGTGKIPCDLPKVEMDLDAGDELFLEVRNRKGEIVLWVKADVQGAFNAELERQKKRHQKALEMARKENAR